MQNGTGHRGTWGRLGDEYNQDAITALDENDPNFDPEDVIDRVAMQASSWSEC